MVMEAKVSFQELYNLLSEAKENREKSAVEKMDLESKLRVSQIKVSTACIITSLTECQEDIEKKVAESTKLWKKSVEMYQKFLKENPGSTQMRPPTAPPTLPSSVETIKGYIKLFDSVVDDQIYLELNFLKEIFNLSAKGVSDARNIRDSYVAYCSGATVNTNWLYSGSS